MSAIDFEPAMFNSENFNYHQLNLSHQATPYFRDVTSQNLTLQQALYGRSKLKLGKRELHSKYIFLIIFRDNYLKILRMFFYNIYKILSKQNKFMTKTKNSYLGMFFKYKYNILFLELNIAQLRTLKKYYLVNGF